MLFVTFQIRQGMKPHSIYIKAEKQNTNKKKLTSKNQTKLEQKNDNHDSHFSYNVHGIWQSTYNTWTYCSSSSSSRSNYNNFDEN